MRPFLFLLAMLAGALPPAATAAACARPDPALLRTTWQSFRAATLGGQPQELLRFYRFPLGLLSPFDGDKPRRLSRADFLAHYDALFRRRLDGDTDDLLTQMKKSGGNEFIREANFDADKCAYAAATRIGDYYFVYGKKSGWQVESLYHPYWNLYEMLVQ